MTHLLIFVIHVNKYGFVSSVKYYQVQLFLDKYIRPNDKNRQIQFLIDYCNLSNDLDTFKNQKICQT